MTILLKWIPRRAAPFSILAVTLLLGQGALSHASRIPSKPQASPTGALSIQPEKIELQGPRSRARIIVTWKRPDGSAEDVTDKAILTSAGSGAISIASDRTLRPSKDGYVRLRARYQGAAADAQVRVTKSSESIPVSFRNEVIPILTHAGCNQGACHGSQYGKGGFKLSLAGFDPDSDYIQIARKAGSRRVDVTDPTRSLFLRKPLMRIPHAGGRRLDPDSEDYLTLAQWIAEGARMSAGDEPVVAKIEVLPSLRVMQPADPPQRIVVRATYTDGASRDVTDTARLASLNEGVAFCTAEGVVKPAGKGMTAITARYGGQVATATFIIPFSGIKNQKSKTQNQKSIDSLVEQKQSQLGLAPSPVCDDVTFIRRVAFDLVGGPPTIEEIEAFRRDTTPDKRFKLVDSLLERPAYADFWALKWGDLLRVNRVPLSPKGAYVFAEWIRSQFRANRPADQFVRDLLLARGSAFTNGPVNFYRVASNPQDWAESAAQVFLGVRLQCAKCHHHPTERWSRDDYYRFSAFFARLTVKGVDEVGVFGSEQAVRLNHDGQVYHPRTGAVLAPAPLGSMEVKDSDAIGDRRVHLAEWLTGTGKRMFAKNLANRYWGYLFGKGIVNPVDDLRATNPPTNPELLEYLTDELIANGYDLKKLIRLICTSKTYQRSSESTAQNRQDEWFFTRYYPKRLPAESLLDAIDFACGTREKFPELPLGTRAIQIPDPGVTVEFLDIFGRPARVVSCECERVAEPNLSQTLKLMNGELINRKITQKEGRISSLASSKKTDSEALDEIYLVTLGRLPRPQERSAISALIQKPEDRKPVFEDVMITLLNSKEFLFNH